MTGPAPQADAGAGQRALTFPDDTGKISSVRVSGAIDRSHPFFQGMGPTGRSCATCHAPEAGWSLTPALARARFDASGGLDPLFRPHDGANAPELDTGTVAARRTAYGLLLERGVFRIGIPMPRGAEFTLESVDDPYGHASAAELSLFRRPLAAADLRFNPRVMWDGRQTVPGTSLATQLFHQARDAARGHMQIDLPASQLQELVRFETGVLTAQAADRRAGRLDVSGARGGPGRLARQPFYPGINDPFGEDPTGRPFDPDVFRLFRGWSGPGRGGRDPAAARRQIARGERIFNRRQFLVTEVPGFNDLPGREHVAATCGTCHNAPNAGSSSTGALMNLGVERIFRRQPEEPLYTLRNTRTGEQVATRDPGRALVTGRWADVGKFKVPVLRGLAARPPYFHDGTAATLRDVVEFYYTRFSIEAGPFEKEDLEAFLRSL